MEGGGRLHSSVLLLMTLFLVLFATTNAARSHPSLQSLNKELMSAFGMRRADKPCCRCVCTEVFPPELNKCGCEGAWEGECPKACKSCGCDQADVCVCQDKLTISYNDCIADSCSSSSTAGKGPARKEM